MEFEQQRKDKIEKSIIEEDKKIEMLLERNNEIGNELKNAIVRTISKRKIKLVLDWDERY